MSIVTFNNRFNRSFFGHNTRWMSVKSDNLFSDCVTNGESEQGEIMPGNEPIIPTIRVLPRVVIIGCSAFFPSSRST